MSDMTDTARALCQHMIGQHVLGGVTGHEHVHPSGPQVCLLCNRTLDELLSAAREAGRQEAEDALADDASDLLTDIAQLLDGWHCDQSWTEWDESVRRRVSELLRTLLGETGDHR